ncbi:MAG TPA: AMP-binding protein, partial [Lentzea sp.]
MSNPSSPPPPSAHADTFARDHLPPEGLWPTIEFTTPELAYPDRINAATELIDVPVARFGADRPALRTPAGEVWSYGELLTRSNQVAQVLVDDLGLVPGQRVLLRSPNNPWTVAAWLGVLKAGGVVVTTMAALRTRELLPIVERTQPTIALVDNRFVEDAQPLPLEVVAYDDLAARAEAKSGEFTAVDTAADDVALLAPTSGSTGTPKITVHFHRDILSIDNTFGRHVLRLNQDDLVACTAPFAFTFGLGMLVV